MSLSSITPMPRIISRTISIVSYKYEHHFQPMVDDLINYESYFITNQVISLKFDDSNRSS